ncbi:hypothetical protein EXD76_05350 [BEV proteobacterium]|nr:hypothetical protein [Candidatus Symbiopectobacterium sp. Chty_BC]
MQYVYSTKPPGTLIKLRPIGILKMVDASEQDDKIITVPTGKIDLTCDNVKSFSDLPPIEQQRLEDFFRAYKQLPEGRKVVELKGAEDAAAARAIITAAHEKYRATHK